MGASAQYTCTQNTVMANLFTGGSTSQATDQATFEACMGPVSNIATPPTIVEVSPGTYTTLFAPISTNTCIEVSGPYLWRHMHILSSPFCTQPRLLISPFANAQNHVRERAGTPPLRCSCLLQARRRRSTSPPSKGNSSLSALRLTVGVIPGWLLSISISTSISRIPPHPSICWRQLREWPFNNTLQLGDVQNCLHAMRPAFQCRRGVGDGRCHDAYYTANGMVHCKSAILTPTNFIIQSRRSVRRVQPHSHTSLDRKYKEEGAMYNII